MRKVAMALLGGAMMFGAAAASAQQAQPQELATPAEAAALFDRAMAYIDQHGLEAALAAFNDPNGGFKVKDLYIFCITYQGIRTAFGANPAHVGRNVLDLQDRAGRRIVPEMIAVAETGRRGVYEYTWPNPVTNQIGPKFSFIQRVAPDQFCGMGYYQ